MKRLFLLLVLALTVLVVPASAQQANPDVLVWSLVGGDMTTFNRALVTDGNSFTVIGFMMAGLYKIDPDSAQPIPDLATWDTSKDGLTYTFHLKDANWSDGTPITSKDVKFVYDAINSDKVQSPHKAAVGAIAKLETPDDKTVVATLSKPDCTVFGTLGGFAAIQPLPSHLFKADFSDFMTNPWNTTATVTSGEYTVEERKAGEFVRLKASPTYFKGAPKIPSVVFRIVADPATLNQSLETDTVDYGFMYTDQYEQITDHSPFNTFMYPNPNAPIVIMNEQDSSNPQNAYDSKGNLNKLVPNKFFGDLRVRQAIAQGYDKVALAKTLGENSGSIPLSGPIVPAFYKTFDMSGIDAWTYDPDKAKALLKDAGWTDSDGDGILDKDGVKFEVNLVYSPLVDLWTNAATVMQDQLGQIGIKIDIQSQEWSSYLSNTLLSGKYDLTIVGFGGGEQVDGIPYNLLYSKNVVIGGGGFNLSAYVNPKLDTLLDQGRYMPGCDVAARTKIYRQVQQIAHDDVPYDWLVSTTQVNVLNKRVTDSYIGQWSYDTLSWALGG